MSSSMRAQEALNAQLVQDTCFSWSPATPQVSDETIASKDTKTKRHRHAVIDIT